MTTPYRLIVTGSPPTGATDTSYPPHRLRAPAASRTDRHELDHPWIAEELSCFPAEATAADILDTGDAIALATLTSPTATPTPTVNSAATGGTTRTAGTGCAPTYATSIIPVRGALGLRRRSPELVRTIRGGCAAA